MSGTRPWLYVLGLAWLALLAGAAVFVVGGWVSDGEPHFYSEEQARSGMIAYAQHCAGCHGAGLAGTPAAPPLVGDPFWESWGGRPVAELYGYIQDKMPLGRGGSLGRQTYLESTALILWSNRLPASERPLEPDSGEVLARDAQVERVARLAPEVPATDALLGPWMAALRSQAAPGDAEGAGDDPGGGSGAGRGAEAQDGQGDEQGGDRQDPAAQDADEGADQAAGEGVADDGGPEGERDAGADAGVEGSDAPPDAAETTGDIRLSVFPQDAEVTVTPLGGDRGAARSLEGGTHVVAGLAPGEVRIEAVVEGSVLQQVVSVVADEVLEVEMRFPGSQLQASDELPAPPPVAGDELAGVVLDGERLYGRHCLFCHGPQGGGTYGIALADNQRLADPWWPIRRVLLGGRGMPSFHRTLEPSEIAEVVSYVRSNFGNGFGAVDADEVRAVREELGADLPSVLGTSLEDAPYGQRRYTQLCSACHGLEGGGDVGPPLAGNPALRDDQLVITRILFGGGIMPSFAHHPDVELAAIASYMRTAWSNDYPPISSEQFEVYRTDAAEGAANARTGTQDDQDAQ